MPDITYGAWFAARTWRSPSRPALTFEDRTWTYGELLEDVDRLAAVLRARGVNRGDRVAYIGENHPMLLQTLIACARIGAIFLPLNLRLAAAELRYILKDAAPTLVIADTDRRPVVDQVRGDSTATGYLAVEGGGDDWEDLAAVQAATEPLATPLQVDEEDLAILMYTSGTTGYPKGVMLSHRNLWWNAQSLMMLYDVHEDDVTLAVAPLFHIAGLNVTIPTTWMKGGHVVLQRGFNAQSFLDTIQRYKVNTLFGVPAMFIGLMNLPGFADADLTSCRLAICGGAPVPDHVLRTLSDRGIRMLQGYGLTETCPVAIFLVAEHSLTKLGSCGFPAMYTESKLVDPGGAEIGRDQPYTPGEVCLRGPNITRGYWNNPGATAVAFDEAGWFHTGDIGQYDDDGFCYIVDRLKDMVISGGENAFPAEVENVLFEHPAIAEVAVIGLPHEKWGEAVTAVAALNPGSELTLEELREFAAGRLARYKMPLSLHIVDALPRNPAGKVLKTTLRDTLATGDAQA